MMAHRKSRVRQRWLGVAALVTGAVFQLGLVESCNDTLLNLTDYVDPCGTFLANCAPGDFAVFNSQPGNFCVDPACTLPGQCDNEGHPLGTQFDLCP